MPCGPARRVSLFHDSSAMLRSHACCAAAFMLQHHDHVFTAKPSHCTASALHRMFFTHMRSSTQLQCCVVALLDDLTADSASACILVDPAISAHTQHRHWHMSNLRLATFGLTPTAAERQHNAQMCFYEPVNADPVQHSINARTDLQRGRAIHLAAGLPSCLSKGACGMDVGSKTPAASWAIPPLSWCQLEPEPPQATARDRKAGLRHCGAQRHVNSKSAITRAKMAQHMPIMTHTACT